MMKTSLFLLPALCLFLLINLYVNDASAKTAPYVAQEATSFVSETKLTGEGTIFTITGTGTSIDGVQVKVPAGAMPKGTLLKIGYEKGTLHKDFQGKLTDTALVIITPNVTSYAYPLEITAPTKLNKKISAGFAIDQTGRGLPLSRLRSLPLKDRNAITFFTFRPLKMIWMRF